MSKPNTLRLKSQPQQMTVTIKRPQRPSANNIQTSFITTMNNTPANVAMMIFINSLNCLETKQLNINYFDATARDNTFNRNARPKIQGKTS
ncbi:MAG: hypothetical protein K8963_04000 [Proteobacteria bacterium]|nr:hypothetical protein [Pseudomonadota bacterium]